MHAVSPWWLVNSGGTVFSKRRIRSLLCVALEQRDQWFVDVMTSDFEAQTESAFKAE